MNTALSIAFLKIAPAPPPPILESWALLFVWRKADIPGDSKTYCQPRKHQRLPVCIAACRLAHCPASLKEEHYGREREREKDKRDRVEVVRCSVLWSWVWYKNLSRTD